MTKEEFETYCQKVLIGRVIRRVVYGDMNYGEEYEEPQRWYKTNFTDIHTLDYSINFYTDSGILHITWDGTFYQYGLYPFLLTEDEYVAKTHEQKWEVSDEIIWTPCIGKTIEGLEIIWDDVYDTTWLGQKRLFAICPTAFLLHLTDDKRIVISAAELRLEEGPHASGLMDNLLVTTNEPLARQVKMIF